MLRCCCCGSMRPADVAFTRTTPYCSIALCLTAIDPLSSQAAAPQESEEQSDDEASTTAPAQAATVQAAGPSSSKKKNKKKPKKGKAAASPSEDPSITPNISNDEDIDAILKELNLTPAANTATTTSSSKAASAVAASPLLGVDTKKLRGDEELRRIFGAGVIEAVERQEAAESSSGAGAQGVRRRGVMPRNMPRRRPLRKSIMVNPREDWPWMETGLNMVVAGRGGGGGPVIHYATEISCCCMGQCMHKQCFYEIMPARNMKTNLKLDGPRHGAAFAIGLDY